MSSQRFVVHLPVTAADLPAALRLGRAVTRALGFLPEVDGGGTTISTEDAQSARHWVFCDQLLDGGRRCPQPADHDGDCADPTVAPHQMRRVAASPAADTATRRKRRVGGSAGDPAEPGRNAG
ncbi:hypothetical protein [Micromonospora sp. KC606]|uniref:hypothetical protein n=1 Tax=Micromonospora sp. KC606 TaxID=2530379 RepID=UPI0026C30B33